MSDDNKKLPAGWEVKRLGDVCDYEKIPKKSQSIPYIGLEHIESNTGLFIGSYEPTAVKSLTFQFDSTHILYGRLRPYLNKVYRPNFIGHCSTEIFPIKPKSCINRDYLFHWLQNDSTVTQINATCTGARMPRADMQEVLEFQIPLPPFSEQKRIVDILDKSFCAIAEAKENAEKNLANARELFEGYLNQVFANPGEDWEEKKLGDVCDLYQGIAINAKTKHALVEKSDLPLLRIKDLKNNSQEQYIDPNNYPKNALVDFTDIIYTRTGSLGLVFRGRKGVLHNNSFKITPRKLLNPDYLYIWLQNPIFKAKILALASRAAQPDITHVLFKQQEIGVPSLSEQKKIITNLDALSQETKKLELLYQQKIANLDELKKSILDKAFSGEL